MDRSMLASLAVLVSISGTAANAAQMRTATIVLKAGDTPPRSGGRPVVDIYTPQTDRDGKVGFTGRFQNPDTTTEAFVWRDTGVAWLNSDAPAGYVVTGQPEESMGAGPAGQWAYSPSTQTPDLPSGDSIWVNGVLVGVARQPAPGIPGRFFTFLSGPMMCDDGSLGFVAGTATTPGGSTSQRAFYRVTFTPGPNFTVVFKTGDVINIGGVDRTIRFASPTIQFRYDLSDDGLHHCHILGLDPSTASTASNIYLDGALLASQGGPIDGGPPAAAWSSFTMVGVNNAGTAIVVGQHNQANGRVISVGNSVWIHNNDFIAGTDVVTVSPLVASINNAGKIAHVWTVDDLSATTVRAVLLGDSTQPGVQSAIVVKAADTLDVDGNGTPDYVVNEINATSVVSNGIDLGDDGDIYVNLTITPIAGGSAVAAVVKFHVYDPCPCVADFDQSGGTPDAGDIDGFFGAWLSGDPAADADCSGGTPDTNDIDVFFQEWLAGGC